MTPSRTGSNVSEEGGRIADPGDLRQPDANPVVFDLGPAEVNHRAARSIPSDGHVGRSRSIAGRDVTGRLREVEPFDLPERRALDPIGVRGRSSEEVGGPRDPQQLGSIQVGLDPEVAAVAVEVEAPPESAVGGSVVGDPIAHRDAFGCLGPGGRGRSTRAVREFQPRHPTRVREDDGAVVRPAAPVARRAPRRTRAPEQARVSRHSGSRRSSRSRRAARGTHRPGCPARRRRSPVRSSPDGRRRAPLPRTSAGTMSHGRSTDGPRSRARRSATIHPPAVRRSSDVPPRR